MLEYANILLILFCARATRLPTVMVSTAIIITASSHPGMEYAWPNILNKTLNPAAFDPADIKAVTGVGAPSYTSGVHIWNGTADTLKPNPINNSPIPIHKIVLPPPAVLINLFANVRFVVPVPP